MEIDLGCRRVAIELRLISFEGRGYTGGRVPCDDWFTGTELILR